MAARWCWVVAVAGCRHNTDLVFEVVPVPPAAVINAPSDGATFTTDQTVDLLGVVADGDGVRDLASVVWSSSVDGVLSDDAPDRDGTTGALVTLSEGGHVLTLTAIDEEGLEGSYSISVEVCAGGCP